MKVLERAMMKNGVTVQLEDWKDDTGIWKTLSIGAYPIAKNTGKYKWILGGEKFRLSINRGWETEEEVLENFKALISGTVTLEDLSDHFWNGNKDKWYLGMAVEYQGW